MSDNPFANAPVPHTGDADHIDVTDLAREYGFRASVRIARHAYRIAVACDPSGSGEDCRLRELLERAHPAYADAPIDAERVEFRIRRRNAANELVPVILAVQVTADRRGRTVATITHPSDE